MKPSRDEAMAWVADWKGHFSLELGEHPSMALVAILESHIDVANLARDQIEKWEDKCALEEIGQEVWKEAAENARDEAKQEVQEEMAALRRELQQARQECQRLREFQDRVLAAAK